MSNSHRRIGALPLALALVTGAVFGVLGSAYLAIRKKADYRHAELVQKLGEIQTKSDYRRFVVDFVKSEDFNDYDPVKYIGNFSFHTPLPKEGSLSDFFRTADENVTKEFPDSLALMSAVGKQIGKKTDRARIRYSGSFLQRAGSYATNFLEFIGSPKSNQAAEFMSGLGKKKREVG